MVTSFERFGAANNLQERDIAFYKPVDGKTATDVLATRIVEAVYGEGGRSDLALFTANPSGQIPDMPNHRFLTLEREALQRIALGEMAKFGFDPEKFTGATDATDGTGRRMQRFDYPSQNDPSIVFEKRTSEINGELISVVWSVNKQIPKQPGT